MTEVKICGISDKVALDAASAAGAEWIGFNFFPPSPRYVTPRTAAALSAWIGRGPRRVGLFVQPTEATIAQVLDTVTLNALQIYGAVDLLPTIRERFGLPVWRAVGIETTADLPAGHCGASRLLLEAKPPAGADRPGGNAAIFDWSVTRGWAAPVPWVLAGGLTPDNVAAAIRQANPQTVDVSSGVETSPGVKDAALIRRFIAAARGAGT